ncbi:MAG: hypothetical protein GYB24_05285 [Rhodobacteraceae bacterium]|nr:hypothetical protein [Paracoccaceae bacterium]
MRRFLTIVLLVPLIIPAAGQAQGLFAFKGAAPATGGFHQSSIVAPPVQATLNEVPSLDGPYGDQLPSLRELGESEAETAETPTTAQPQKGTAAPVVSLRPRMNPLREPVREKRKVKRFIRRLLKLPSAQEPQAAKRQNISSLQTGTPLP